MRIAPLKPEEKLFFIARLFAVLESIYFMCYGNPWSVPSFILGLLNLGFIIKYIFFHEDKNQWLKNEINIYILIVILAIELPLFFLASARIASKNDFYDKSLIKFDIFFLGNFYPKGQLSLFLDENEYFGPITTGGKIINNILLLFYFTYYAIPYFFFFVILIKKCIQETIFRYKNKGEESPSYKETWINFYFSITVYIFTYSQIVIINTIIPAVSPRMYLKSEYKNEIIYFGLIKYIANIRDDESANSFPSGHVAETISLVLPFYLMKRYFSGTFILIDSLLIALATLVLRYHYFIDVLIALLNSLLSFIFCCLLKIILKVEIKEIKNSNVDSLKLINSVRNSESSNL